MIVYPEHEGVKGTISRGLLTLKGEVVAVDRGMDTFVFLSDGSEATFQTAEWDFEPDPARPVPGWYWDERNRERAPLWVDAEGDAHSFFLKAADEDGNVVAGYVKITVPWGDLTPLHPED